MIVTERCILRKFVLEDALEVFTLARDPLVGPRCGWQPHKDVEETKEVIQNILSAEGVYAIVLKDSNKVVGAMSLLNNTNANLSLGEGERELGCWIGRAYWHQGFAYECAKALIYYNDCKVIWAMCDVENEASFGLQRKLGFEYLYQKENKKISKFVKPDCTNFYLVRHGQTMFNAKKLVQGWCDAPLTELGINQAVELGKNWDISNIEIAYSSTSERAVDTMHYIVQGRIPCFEHKGFKEINFGDYEGDKVDVVFPKGTVHIRSYEDIHGEDKAKAANRFLNTMKEVAQSSGCKNIMIVAHGSIIREILCRLSEYYRKNEMPTFKMVPNCSVTKIGLIKDEFLLLESPKVYK